MFNLPEINCFSNNNQFDFSSSKVPGKESGVSQLSLSSFSANSNSSGKLEQTAMPIPTSNYSDTLFSIDTESLKRPKNSEDATIGQFSFNQFVIPSNNSLNQRDLYQDGRLFYQGDIVDNKKHGQGTLYHGNGKVAYQGGFVDDQPSGEGKKYHVDGGLMYSGSFAAGAPHGAGTVFTPNGAPLVIGMWNKGNITHGTKYFQKGSSFVGSFVNGRVYDGRLFNSSGCLMYRGQFSNEIANGFGTIFYSNGTRYEGMVVNGRGCGQGRVFGQNDELLNSGIFKDDIQVGRQ
ncbi:MAG: hypothetical protein Q8K75_12465 [Chlamydiales bacterium]|nr:hypothetical protein [Chlamydiales bacterium]